MNARKRETGPRAAAARKNVLVGMWMNGVFGHEFCAGMYDWLAENGVSWRTKFVTLPNTLDHSFNWLERTGQIDGVVTHFDNVAMLPVAGRLGIPVVFVGPESRSGAAWNGPGRTAVYVDTAAIARAAAEHFFSRTGFRSFAFVNHARHADWSRLRGEAFEAELAKRGIALNWFNSRVMGGLDYGSLGAWLRELEKPAAVLCANDDMAVDTLRLCEVCGIAVPRDVAVLGMDDNPLHCLNSVPNLSSIHFDARAGGHLAASALAAMMDGVAAPAAPLRYGVERIAHRASTGAVSTAGALVQKALDFIEAQACRGASTADVVRHLGVSYALATMRFRELRGESILDALAGRRVEEAKKQLRDTDKPLDSIARECGFSGPGALCRAFRAATGTTPGRFRQSRESS